MREIHENTKKFYQENPELFEQRKQLDWDVLCDRFESKIEMWRVAKDFERLWELAKSFYKLPDEKDYARIINKNSAPITNAQEISPRI